MNLETAIIDYRRNVQGLNTSREELKKDLDMYSNKLIALFANMNVDYYCLKEAGRKNGQWVFSERVLSVLFDIFGQLLDKDSAAGMVIVGKSKDVRLNDLVKLVDLCMKLLGGAGISKDEIDVRREKVYRRLHIPLLEVSQELHGLENVINVSFNNEGDSLPLELHMKFQQYFARQIRVLKIEAALMYLSMNQEYEYLKLREEVSKIKMLDGRGEYEEKVKNIGEILKSEFPELNIANPQQVEAYVRRRNELMKMSRSEFLNYIDFMTQQAKIDKLCVESQEYCEQVDVLNKNLCKAVNIDTKVRNYVREEEKLQNIRNKIIMEQLGEEELECPDVVLDYFGNEDTIDIESLFSKNLSLIGSMLKYNKDIEKTILFEMSEQLFGKLL